MKAFLKNYNQSPRKTRLVANTIRGKQVPEALVQLSMISKRATLALQRLLSSAAANAKETKKINIEDLYVKEIRVDDGVILKRMRPAWHGTAHRIRHRRSHISIELGERKTKIEETVSKTDNKKKVEK